MAFARLNRSASRVAQLNRSFGSSRAAQSARNPHIGAQLFFHILVKNGLRAAHSVRIPRGGEVDRLSCCFEGDLNDREGRRRRKLPAGIFRIGREGRWIDRGVDNFDRGFVERGTLLCKVVHLSMVIKPEGQRYSQLIQSRLASHGVLCVPLLIFLDKEIYLFLTALIELLFQLIFAFRLFHHRADLKLTTWCTCVPKKLLNN